MDPEELARLAALVASGAVTRKMERVQTQFRAASPAPSTYDPEAHTVELTAATGTRVKRYSWMVEGGYYWEQLAITADAIDLTRVTAGQCPLLDTHNRWQLSDQLGLIQAARIEDDELVLVTKFGTSDAAVAVEGDVAANIVRGVSIGYAPKEMVLANVTQDDLPVYLVTSWELLEASFCPVPADPAAGVRSDDGLHPCAILNPKETRTMDPEEEARLAEEAAIAARQKADEARARVAAARTAPATPTATPAAPVATAATAATVVADASAARMTAGEAIDFAEQARSFGVDDAEARKWVTDLTPEAARAKLLTAASEKQRAAAPLRPSHSVTITTDERSTQRAAIGIAVRLRKDPKLELKAEELEIAREFRGMTLLEMFRYAEDQNGHKLRGLSKRELADAVFDRANSTSDFPNILANVANKTLRDSYEASPQTFKLWMRPASAPDFKQISRVQLSGAPSLLQVPEGGEFKMGSLSDAKEVYALATYGRIIPITRQTLVNDDLDAFTRVPELIGRAVADFESDAAYAPLNANPNMADGNPLYGTGTGNQAAAGAAISVTSIQAAEIAMGSQVGLEGRPITITPAYLLTGIKDKVPAQQLLSAIVAQQAANVNPYSNAMKPVVEVRLNRASGATPWYVVADYKQIDTFEYCYLEGEDGAYTETREGYEVDGLQLKVRLDYAVKAIDRKGIYQNPGT